MRFFYKKPASKTQDIFLGNAFSNVPATPYFADYTAVAAGFVKIISYQYGVYNSGYPAA